MSSMFTTFWLVDAIERVQAPEIPDLRNAEGDELVLCEVRYPLAAGTTAKDIGVILKARPEFCPTSTTSWNWISREKPAPASRAGEQSQQSQTFETWNEDGALVLGGVKLENSALVLSVNSRQRSDLGHALLSGILGRRVGQPSFKTETVEQIMASRDVRRATGARYPRGGASRHHP